MQIQAHLLDACTEYITAGIRHVVDSFGPRDPGSPGEHAAQQYFKEQLEPFVDGAVTLEPFEVRPKAFMGFMPIVSVLLLAGAALYWLVPTWAAPLSWAALLITVLEFGLYRTFLDPLFPRRTSHNLVAVQPAEEEPRRILILTGHADAAYEMRYNRMSTTALRLAAGGAIVGGLFFLATDTLSLVFHPGWEDGYQNLWGAVGAARLLFVPAFAAFFFFTDFRSVSPGANDNLTGAFTAAAAARYLREAGIRFPHTEIRYLITGSEEAGLRGAKAYAAAHAGELPPDRTSCIALETFRDLQHFAVGNRDLNGLVSHDPRVCELLKLAGRDCGLDLPFQTVYMGASDAVAFTQTGIPSGLLEAMDPTPPRYYHTRFDTPGNLDPACIRKALEITLAAVARFDRDGLPEAAAPAPQGGKNRE
mgnify:CR=1 FL=1